MLKGVRILDLTMHLAGPYCCWLLASLGADVIKVERPDGDPARETGPFCHGESTYFGSVNRNKRAVVLDLKSDGGKEHFRKLVQSADVLVENFRAGVLERLGFGVDELKKLNPNLIVGSITGFGQEGSMARRPAFDVVIQGMSGMMSMTGNPDGEPMRVGVSIADITAGIFAALGIVSALYKRKVSGKAERLDISMLHCQLALLENAVGRYLNAGELATRTGNRHALITPFQAYPVKDGTIVVAADGERNWRAMCEALGLASLVDDHRFANNAARVEHCSELEALLVPVFQRHTANEVLEKLLAFDVPCGPVNSVADILGSDYVDERKVVSTVQREDGAKFRYVSNPIVYGTATTERAAPAVGQHTDEVLRETGLGAVDAKS